MFDLAPGRMNFFFRLFLPELLPGRRGRFANRFKNRSLLLFLFSSNHRVRKIITNKTISYRAPHKIENRKKISAFYVRFARI